MLWITFYYHNFQMQINLIYVKISIGTGMYKKFLLHFQLAQFFAFPKEENTREHADSYVVLCIMLQCKQ